MCIIRFFKKHGGRWATLAKYSNIPTSGRTDNTLKNRWYSGGLSRRYQAGEYKDLPAWDDSCVESSSNISDKFAPPPAVAAAAAAVAARKKQRGVPRVSKAGLNLGNANSNDDGDDNKAPVVAAMPPSKPAPSHNTRYKAAAPGVVRPQLKRSAMELIKQAAAVIQAVAAKRSADDKQATLKAEVAATAAAAAAAAAPAKPAGKKAAPPRKAPSAIVNNDAAATATEKPAEKKATPPRKALSHAKNKKLNVAIKAATAKTSATVAAKAHAGPKAGTTAAPPPPPPPPSTRNRRRKQAKPASTLNDVPPVSPPPALKKSVAALGVLELEAGLGKRKRKAPSRFSNFTALSPLLNKRRAVDSTDEDNSDSDKERCTDNQQQQQVEQKQVEQKQPHTAGFSPSLNSYFKGNSSNINNGTFISPSFLQNQYNMPTDIVKKLSENEYSILKPCEAPLLPGLMVDKLFSDAAKIRPPPSSSGGSTAPQQQQQQQQGCGFFPLSIFNNNNKKHRQQQQQQRQEQLEQIVEIGDITGTKIALEKEVDGTTDNANTKAGEKQHLPTPTTMIDIAQGPLKMDGLPLLLSQQQRQQQQYAVPMRKLSPLMDLTVNNNVTAATAIKMSSTGGGGGGSDVLKTSQTDSLSSPELKSVVTQCLRVAVNLGGGAGSTPMNVGALRNSLLQLVTEPKANVKSHASSITKYHLTALNGGNGGGIKSHAIPVDAEMVDSPVGEAAIKGFLDQATVNNNK